MLIFTSGRKSLKHWLTISARSQSHAFIHAQAFPLEQWSATYGILGKKGTSADLEWHAAGLEPFSTEGTCHPSAGSRDFASCKARWPQTRWYPGFKPSAKQKPSPLLETQCWHPADWSRDSALSLELIFIRTRDVHAPDTFNLRLEQGAKKNAALPLKVSPALMCPCARAPATQRRSRIAVYCSLHWALLVDH